RNNVPFAKFIKSLKTNQDEDEITPELLRKIGAKHASMVHAGPNPTPQHLDNLSEIALRHKINRLDAGKNYALGDPKSKKEPISDSENTPSLVPQLKNDDYNPFKGQIAEIDSMLVEAYIIGLKLTLDRLARELEFALKDDYSKPAINLLECLPPKLIPFIIKDLSNQDLKNFRSINDIWVKEVDFEWSKRKTLFDFQTGSLVQSNDTLFLKGISSENTFKVLLDGLEILALDEIMKRLSQSSDLPAN
ncbi:22604_t:CDS:2, partial [Rhizophagus irregularis]